MKFKFELVLLNLLEIILKPRTRIQIKNKFLKEERINSIKIGESLKNHDSKKLLKILTILKKLKEEVEIFLLNILS